MSGTWRTPNATKNRTDARAPSGVPPIANPGHLGGQLEVHMFSRTGLGETLSASRHLETYSHPPPGCRS